MAAKTIIIVEDEKIIAEDIKSTLVRFKYKVPHIISNGEVAIREARQHKPDLILMDIMIEGEINGIEAAKRIYHDLGIPIIFLTAYADEKILKQAAESSPFGYLIKPFEDRELHATIEMAFYKSDMEQKLKRNRNFLLKVIDTVPSNIFVKDKNGRYLMVNTSIAKLYNTTPKEMIGKTDRELLLNSKLTDVDLEKIAKEDLEVIKGKKKVLIPEESYSLDDGKKIWFQTTKVPLDSPDIPDVLLGVSNDITPLKNSFIRLQELMEETVNGLILAVEKRDPYTAGHQRRVSMLTNAIGAKMNLDQFQLDGLRIASIVHDIGKLYVPSEILSKPGRLTEAEFALIKTHPQAGFEILSSINFPWPVAKIVLQHHERLDGSGYPNGLKKREIILEAQIIAVADVIEAMASHRPYRPALGMDKAIEEVESHKGVLYNKVIVDTFLDLIKNNEFSFTN